MRSTDIRIVEINLRFTEEAFRTPLLLSSGPISGCTYAYVAATVENRRGQRAVGIGGVFLSDLWAFPQGGDNRKTRAGCMEAMTEAFVNRVRALPDACMDPFQWEHVLEAETEGAAVEAAARFSVQPAIIPLLARIVCRSPVDAAIHDGWARAAGSSAYRMYNEDGLNDDLSVVFGPDWKGIYPEAFLRRLPLRTLEVQHVVSGNDRLLPLQAEAGSTATGSAATVTVSGATVGILQDGLPLALSEWIQQDGLFWFKLKLKGEDMDWNDVLIRNVYDAAAATLAETGSKAVPRLVLDPNEACPSPQPLTELLLRMRVERPEVFKAIQYIEQPTGRQLDRYTFTLHELAAVKPVIIDESLESLDILPLVESQGWSGVALKSAKGHTHSLLAYCWARRKDHLITVQDLTNPGHAFMHSAGFAAHLQLYAPAVEYNSRQYAPFSFPELQKEYGTLFTVKDGLISTDNLSGVGLY